MAEENINQETLSAEQEKILELEKQLATASRVNADLQSQLEAKVAGSPDRLVKHSKDTYRQVIPKFRLNNREYTHEALLADKSLVAALVKMGSGVLLKVED